MAKKSKEISEKNVTFARGGKNRDVGRQHAGPQAPGSAAHKTTGSGGKFAAGGSNDVMGFRPSQPARSGKSAPK